MKFICIVLIIISNVFLVNTYKVLLFFPYPGTSHTILAEGFIRNLVDAGHEVTYITSVMPKKTYSNTTVIELNGIKEEFMEAKDKFHHKMMSERSSWEIYHVIIPAQRKLVNSTMHHHKLQTLFKDKSVKYDVMLVDWMFLDTMDMLGGVIGAPAILCTTTESHFGVLRRIETTSSPASTYDISYKSDHNFDFKYRWKILFNTLSTELFIRFSQTPVDKEIYKSSLKPIADARGVELEDYYEANKKVSLILTNTYIPLFAARPLPLNVKMIGGHHIPKLPDPLPEDIQRIMDESKYGIILVSFGSVTKSEHVTDEKKKAILKVLGEVKQTVLWKSDEDFVHKPKNVHIKEWLPQASILAHENIKAFVTHCGQLSSIEALHFGVPIIGVPLCCDQYYNSNRLSSIGVGYRASFDNIEETLRAGLDAVLNNATYRNKAKEISSLYHDRIQSPIDESLYWIEYVVRTKGAEHLMSVTRSVPLYQLLYLDLLGLLVGVIIILIWTFKKLFGLLKLQMRKSKVE